MYIARSCGTGWQLTHTRSLDVDQEIGWRISRNPWISCIRRLSPKWRSASDESTASDILYRVFSFFISSLSLSLSLSLPRRHPHVLMWWMLAFVHSWSWQNAADARSISTMGCISLNEYASCPMRCTFKMVWICQQGTKLFSNRRHRSSLNDTQLPCRCLLSYSPGGCTRREVGPLGAFGNPICGRGDRRGSAMVPFERAMVVS